MKAISALNILNITRQTLTKYVKSGKIKVTKLPSGVYDYDTESVCEAKNNFKKRIVAVYFGGIDSSMQEQCRKVIDQFVKDNMEQDSIQVYYDKDMDGIISDVLKYKVKKVILLEASDAVNAFDTLSAAFENVCCDIQVLRCYQESQVWGIESEESLQAFVRRALSTVKDKRFREKLECIERILRM